ncbi:hypothetical protein D3C87_850610 [compost metagenome]
MDNSEKLLMGIEQKSIPRFLNKYRVDDDNTRKIITENELWFSDPLVFNDPYDCNTPIHKKTSLENIKKWLRSISLPEPSIELAAKELKNNPDLMKEKTMNVISRVGICCFSTLEDSILQWSHYSNYHHGVCFKFDLTMDPSFFLTPLVVSYKNVMQHYNHFTVRDRIFEYLIQTKFSAWSYESEVRIIKQHSDIDGNNKSRAFKFESRALIEIIFGVKTPKNIIREYKKLCKGNGKSHVKFSQMRLGDGVHYELKKRLIR